MVDCPDPAALLRDGILPIEDQTGLLVLRPAIRLHLIEQLRVLPLHRVGIPREPFLGQDPGNIEGLQGLGRILLQLRLRNHGEEAVLLILKIAVDDGNSLAHAHGPKLLHPKEPASDRGTGRGCGQQGHNQNPQRRAQSEHTPSRLAHPALAVKQILLLGAANGLVQIVDVHSR